MAEALAVVGLVASIVQLVDFSGRLVDRLKEFQSATQDLPKAFQDISIQLPLLVNTLRRTQSQATAGHVSSETAGVLKPVVEGCLSRIRSLEEILAKALPTQESSAWERSFKALSSLRYDKAVLQISLALQSYVQYLTYHEASHKASILAVPPELRTEPDGEQRNTCFMVRYDRDPNFVGREDIIKEIDKRFVLGQRRVALAGIGGVGKSQIAIEYCYRKRKCHPEIPVFWIHARNKARLEEGYRNIAGELALPGLLDPTVDTVQLVTRWLGDELNGPWLLILDNVDDIEALHGACHLISAQLDQKETTASNSTYIPPSERGLIIITTRDRRVGERLAHRQQPIFVQPLTNTDAKHLLWRKLPEPADLGEADCDEFLEALDYLPLAITQATSFISENGITLTEYLNLLRAGDSDTIDILKEDLPDPGRDRETQNSIYRTWKLSFDQISLQDPRAAEILSIMAILDRQTIPDLLLRKESDGKVVFIKAIGTLKAYSLITEEKQGSIFGMHRLVQFAIKMWLDAEGSMAQWQGKAVEALYKVSPHGRDYEDWSVWRSLDPHIQSVRSCTLSTYNGLEQRAYLLTGIGAYHIAHGQYKAASEELKEALASREHTLGPNHLLTLNTIRGLGNLYWDQMNLSEAEVMYEHVLAGFTAKLGPHHKETLKIFVDLGIMYTSQQKWAEAHSLYLQVLKQHGKELPGGFETYKIYRYLGDLSAQEGKLAEADDFYGRALNGLEKLSGLGYSDTFRVSYHMAYLYERQGRLVDAEDTYRRALKDGKLSDPDRPEIPRTLFNLGLVCAIQKKYADAENIFQQAVMECERLRGPDHLDTINATIGLGHTQYDQGKLAKAEITFQRAAAQIEKVLGLGPSLTREPLHRLRSLYKYLGRITDAEATDRKLWSNPYRCLYCDSCDGTITTLNTFYHCSICRDDDFDLCEACFGNGKTCFDKAHRLVKRYYKDGRHTDDEEDDSFSKNVASEPTQLLSVLDMNSGPMPDAKGSEEISTPTSSGPVSSDEAAV